MDKQKEEKWYQKWWIQLIIAPLFVGFVLLLISDYNKVEPFITNVKNALQTIWQFILNFLKFDISFDLGWLLLGVFVLIVLFLLRRYLPKQLVARAASEAVKYLLPITP